MHINQITTKANHTLSLLQRNIKLAPKKTKELVYKSLVRSQLEYASIVWPPWQNALINSIEKIQRRAARYVVNDYNPYSSVTNHLIDLNWEPLEARRIKSRLCMFYKMIHNYITIPFNLYAPPRIQDSQIIINSYKYHVERTRTNNHFFQIQFPIGTIYR